MDYVISFVLGMIGGGISVFIAVDARRRWIQRKVNDLEVQAVEIDEKYWEVQDREKSIPEQSESLARERKEFDSQAVNYTELRDENLILKRDLRNVAVEIRKAQLDRREQQKQHDLIAEKVAEIGSLYLKENVKWIGRSLNSNNYVACKQRLSKVIERCRNIEFAVSIDEEESLFADLKQDYEKAVHVEFERAEQARIKAQIREERQREREIERELKRLEREREAIKAALEKALADAADHHSEEIERLKSRLAEAEAMSQRAIAQAQLTKSGNVYVISNIGSFGRDVFKIGMTRRLDPQLRVRELGDASVPFPFDVHMMISSDDAPTLENALHRALHKSRINKVNPRKEFFRTSIDEISSVVRKHHGEVEFIADAEALEYRQSADMSEEDQEFIEHVYEELEDESEAFADEN